MSLELNIEKIGSIARQKEKENLRFRSFLKGLDSDKVDIIVHRLHQEIVEQIDCTECGNCCNNLKPLVNDNEIERLSQIDNLPVEEFKIRFTELDDIDDGRYLKDIPCKYLMNKKCIIYSSRPKDCKSYPHTHKKNFTSRTLGMIYSVEICPIVFNIFERLKSELRFR